MGIYLFFMGLSKCFSGFLFLSSTNLWSLNEDGAVLSYCCLSLSGYWWWLGWLFSNFSFSYCRLASSNERLPLNDGENPLNTFDGGRKLPPLEGNRFLCFNGELSRSSLNGFFNVKPFGGGGPLSGLLLGLFGPGRWDSLWFLTFLSWRGKKSGTSSCWRAILSWLENFFLLGGGPFLGGGPLEGRGPFLLGLMILDKTSPNGLVGIIQSDWRKVRNDNINVGTEVTN